MATRGHRSAFSSRSVSPVGYPEPYDPYSLPIELNERQNLDSRSPDGRSVRGHRDQPLGISFDNESPSTYPAASARRGRSSNNYIPLAGQSDSPQIPSGQNESPHTPYGFPTRRGSLSTLGSQFSPYKAVAMDLDTQALVDRRAGELAQWKIHWYTPAMILVLFVGGLIGAVGHHYFYKSLDGRPAKNQLLMIRYGTALAFFTKSTLVGTVILCYRQRIWHTFRKKAMTLNAIDGLFSATEDITAFTILEMIRNAKLATLMALCSWLIPLASVLSPAALTAEMRTHYDFTTCPSVATLNFSQEAEYNFRDKRYFPGSSLVYYNTTDIKAETDGWYDYYDQPSKNAKRLTITSAYLRQAAQSTDASLQACGEGWNCTYTINFQGPGYKCDEVANGAHPNTDEIIAQGAPFNISLLAPVGKHIYAGNVDMGEYAYPQIDSNDGMPLEGQPIPELLGVFQSEPALWIGYAVNTSKPYEPSSPYFLHWRNVHEPYIFKCIAHHTNYTFEQTFTDGTQSSKLIQRDFLKPLVDTNLTARADIPGTMIAVPSENYIRPGTDAELYKLTATYHVLGQLLRNFLRGEIFSGPVMPITKSDISETRLIDALTSYPVPNLMPQVQSMYEDMILTMLSSPLLVLAANVSAPCSKSRRVNVYVYHAEGLWIGYAIVVTLTFSFMLVGAYSIFQNGVASDTQFSRIMVTTRNPTIDRLSVGACLGGDPFPEELKKTKLRFGVLLEEVEREGLFGKVEHCTFGTESETKGIVKFGMYSGLKEWRTDDEADEEVEGLVASEKNRDM